MDDISELTDDELDALLARVWPAVRDQVWLSLPRRMRWGPYRPLRGRCWVRTSAGTRPTVLQTAPFVHSGNLPGSGFNVRRRTRVSDRIRTGDARVHSPLL